MLVYLFTGAVPATVTTSTGLPTVVGIPRPFILLFEMALFGLRIITQSTVSAVLSRNWTRNFKSLLPCKVAALPGSDTDAPGLWRPRGLCASPCALTLYAAVAPLRLYAAVAPLRGIGRTPRAPARKKAHETWTRSSTLSDEPLLAVSPSASCRWKRTCLAIPKRSATSGVCCTGGAS